MFDDGADRSMEARLVEFLCEIPGGLQVDDVVVGEFLALQLKGIGNARIRAVRVHRGLLVRIFAVAQVELFVKRQTQGTWKRGCFRLQLKRVCGDAIEGRGDCGIVRGCGGEGFLREAPLRLLRERAGGTRELIGDGVVVCGGSHDGDVVKILGGGADHRRTADVDVLD